MQLGALCSEHRSSSGAGAEHESARAGPEESGEGGVGREREETWLKRRSEQDGTGEEEKAAIAGQKRDGVRTLAGAARRRDRDEREVAGR